MRTLTVDLKDVRQGDIIVIKDNYGRMGTGSFHTAVVRNVYVDDHYRTCVEYVFDGSCTGTINSYLTPKVGLLL